MRNYKKVIAGTLAATMVLGNSFAALAADQTGTTTGSGSLDVVQKSDIFQVVLPTMPISGSTFSYILDPKGVIEETGAEKYSNATFASGQTVYFQNAASGAASGGVSSGGAGGSASYSNTSDALKVINKSTMDVDVTVNAKVADSTAITMASSGTFAADDKTTSLYLGLKDDDANNAETAITTAGVDLTSKITALANAYETKYESGEYKKVLKSDVDEDDFDTYSFQITGACNPNGEWEGLTETPPAVTVTWTVKDPTVDAAPSASDISAVLGAQTDVDIVCDLGSGTLGVGTVSDVVVTFNSALYSKNGAFNSDQSMGQYITIAGNRITLDGEWLSYFPAGTYPICVVYDGDEAKYTMIDLVVE